MWILQNITRYKTVCRICRKDFGVVNYIQCIRIVGFDQLNQTTNIKTLIYLWVVNSPFPQLPSGLRSNNRRIHRISFIFSLFLSLDLLNRHSHSAARFGSARFGSARLGSASRSLTGASFPAGQTGFPTEKSEIWGRVSEDKSLNSWRRIRVSGAKKNRVWPDEGGV